LDARISSFQATLPHTRSPYSKKTWGHPLHSLCSYQGKLKPSHAHWILKTFTSSADNILDPLGGVGTVAFEAGLLGRRAYTIDISPFPYVVASGKVNPPKLDEVQSFLPTFMDRLSKIELTEQDRSSADFGLNASVRDYYHPETLDEILRARRYFLKADTLSQSEMFVKACLLHVLHGNRPYALSRNSHPVTPFAPTGPFERRSLSKSLADKFLRALGGGLPENFSPGKSFLGDFRNAEALVGREIDAIFTSPPFIGLRFDRPNWLRLWFCGWNAKDFHNVSTAHLERQQSKSLDVYKEFFRVCAAVSRARSPLLIHVGGSKAYNMIDALKAHSDGLYDLKGDIAEDVSKVANHGLVDKGTTTKNHILVFERRA
jgi:hypothetical protein